MFAIKMRVTMAVAMLALALGLIPAGLVAPTAVLADPASETTLVIDYPSVVVQPGQTVNLTMSLVNKSTTGHQFDLDITNVPDGWQTVIKDSSKAFAVKSTYVGPGETKYMTLEAVPPEGVKPSTYSFLVKAASRDGINQSLSVNIGVDATKSSGTKVVSQYPVLTGAPGNKFQFKVDLSNGTGQNQTYNLSATAPQGWDVSFQPAYEVKQISSLSMKAAETQTLNVEVQTPKSAQAGENPIDIQVAAGSERIAGKLKVVITGTPDVTLSTDSQRLNINATAGSTTPMSFQVTNTGSATINTLSLTATKPTGWDVTFDTKSVDNLAPGVTRQVNASIKPDEKAIAGDYIVTISASNPQISKQADVRVTVDTPTIWGWVGILIVLIVVGGLYGIFKSLSRR